MSRFATFALSALLIASCNNNASNVILASLARSAKIQLLCADIEDLPTSNAISVSQFLPLDLCIEGTEFGDEVNANILGAVTQKQAGTVAAMSFTRSFILDTNITVPGVTAVVVGEQPTGIQISPVAPNYTYVSSFSPKSVQAIPTETILTGNAALAVQPPIRFDVGPTDIALHEFASYENVPENGPVTGAKINIDYRFLYVALPELGKVAQIRIQIVEGDDGNDRHGMMEQPTFLDLPTVDCAAVTPFSVPPAVSDADDYSRICPAYVPARGDGRVIKTVKTTETCVDGPEVGPSPVTLTIDYGLETDLTDDVLLVADSNQPVIHRFALFANGATPLDQIVTGAPTLEVDVTPYVPASSDPDDLAATERYLYAVSAADSSVLAIDYTPTSPGSAEVSGAIIPVVAGITARANEENTESRDRVRSAFSNVRAIEVVTPEYEFRENADGSVSIPEASLCDPNDGDAFGLAQNESNMRGVFLAVSLSNGTMYFLDVYDLNAPCRGGEGAIACTIAETGPDQYASIRRHRRRIGFTPTTFIQVDGTPSLQFNSAPGQLDEGTGAASNSDGPGLVFVECPVAMDGVSSMDNMFGIPPTPTATANALICASSQVWSSLTERWEAAYSGLIPNTEGGLGQFSDTNFNGDPGETGSWFLAGDVPFCRVGVLGEQPGPDTNPDSTLSIDRLDTYVGDRLVIVGELPPSVPDTPGSPCEEFKDLEDDLDDFQVWFPIVRAFDDQLEIGPSPNPNRYTLDEVRSCFNQFTQYQIHTQGVYTVTGTATGFVNRIIPDPTTNECVFDPDRPIVPDDVDTFLSGRAFAATQYINPLVSFEIGAFPSTTNVTATTIALLTFNISSQFTPLIIDTSGSQRSLPSSMLFSAPLSQLFFVDFEAGVLRMVFSPLNIAQTFD